MTLRVAVTGAGGRMGRAVAQAVLSDANVVLEVRVVDAVEVAAVHAGEEAGRCVVVGVAGDSGDRRGAGGRVGHAWHRAHSGR